MKKGANLDKQDVNPNLIDMTWGEMIHGEQYIPGYLEKWKGMGSGQRGIIHKVYLTGDPRSEYHNASKLVEMIGTFHLGDVNNGVPIIIDIWGFAPGTQFQFDHVKTYVNYLAEKLNLTTKPLVRIVPSDWNGWYKTNPYEAKKLLNNCDLLVACWNLEKPVELDGIGRQKWFEYKDGLVAYDETGQWVEGVIQEPVEPPVTPPEEPTPEPVLLEAKPVAYQIDCEVKLGFFRGHLKGTLTPIVEESEGSDD